jgi:DNA repair protein RadC
MSAAPALSANDPVHAVEDAASLSGLTAHASGRWAPSRERILDFAGRFGVDVMQDAEILHLQMAGEDRAESFALAERLIARFGGLAGVLAADRAELRRHVGEPTLLNFKILREAAGRISLAALAARPVLSSFGAVADFLRAKLRGLPREEFWVVFLDRRNNLIVAEAMGRGTVDHAPVYPREVLGRALEVSASAVIIAHNHPSGDPEPSRPDIDMTRVIVEAGKVLGVLVHDHLIIGSEKIQSFRALGLL